MKKSSSAVTGLEATVRSSPRPFGGYLELSSDEDDWEISPPPPKKFKSDIGPDSRKELIHTTISTKVHIIKDEEEPHKELYNDTCFAEACSSTPATVLPVELEKDIENAMKDFLEHGDSDHSDCDSSASEFEIDDDSEEEDSLPTSTNEYIDHPNASMSSVSLPLTGIMSSCHPSTSNTTHFFRSHYSSPSQHTVRPSASLNSSTTIKKPMGQAAITNYFGIRQKDGTTAKTTGLVIPTSSVFSTKQLSLPPKKTTAKPTSSTSTSEMDPVEPSWQREPAIKEQCPFYKRISGTKFIVDDFRHVYQVPATTSFFLTHFHSDHYQGITRKFNRGTIYCSPITGALVIHSLGVSPRFVKTIPFREPTLIEGVEVTLFDANHCPGAALILFKLSDGTLHLHTGDFRFDAELPDHLEILSMQGKLANCYLDTTYASPSYSFPHQQLVISTSLELVAPFARDPKTLIVVGTYTIGKERMFLAIAERFNLKFFVRPNKFKILKHLDIDLILREMATSDEGEARIHILPIFELSQKKLESYLEERAGLYNRIIAIKPTGWSYSPQKHTPGASASNKLYPTTPKKTSGALPQGFSSSTSKRGNITIHSVPYSEHSSFTELCTFVRTLRPRWIIPTVNNRSREAVIEMVSTLRGSSK